MIADDKYVLTDSHRCHDPGWEEEGGILLSTNLLHDLWTNLPLWYAQLCAKSAPGTQVDPNRYVHRMPSGPDAFARQLELRLEEIRTGEYTFADAMGQKRFRVYHTWKEGFIILDRLEVSRVVFPQKLTRKHLLRIEDWYTSQIKRVCGY